MVSRYFFFLIIDAIEEDIGNQPNNDKLMERNFQNLGMIIWKFCRYMPKQSEYDCGYDAYLDKFNRVVFKDEFEMLASMTPYFTSPWVDYLICYKYYLMFKKYFSTEWYRKNVRAFENYIKNDNI